MPSQVVSLLTSNWLTGVGLLAMGLLAYWIFDERGETDSAAETVEKVGERADGFFGGVVGAFGSLAVVVTSIVVTLGDQIVMTIAQLDMIIGNVPVLVGHFLFGLLTFLGLGGIIPISEEMLGFAFILITIIALIRKYAVPRVQEAS